MIELYCEDDPTTLTPVGKICKSAVDTWGFEKQLDVVVEELSELILAIQKWKRYRNEIRSQNVAEESADVRLVLLQLQYMFDTQVDRKFTHIMNETVAYKQDRIQRRIARYQDTHPPRGPNVIMNDWTPIDEIE